MIVQVLDSRQADREVGENIMADLTREQAYALIGNTQVAQAQAARAALVKSMREAGTEAQTFTDDELEVFGFEAGAVVRGRKGGDIEHAKRLDDGTLLVILS
jgi:uncharacterized protein YqfA (UPF0365 family)